MKTLLLINGWVGWKVAMWLSKRQDCEIVGAVLHPAEKRKRGKEILSVLPSSLPLFDGSALKDPKTLEAIQKIQPDIAVSVFFGYILTKPFIDMFPKKVVNLHPALLPYNRGAYPNVWSIVEGTPAGVTLHYIDEGVDTGDIIAQKEVSILLSDTGATLYKKLDKACVELFMNIWPNLVSDTVHVAVQNKNTGTSHKVADVEMIDFIDLGKMFTGKELINRIRARTFPHYKGTYIHDEQGKKIYLRLTLLPEAEIGGNSDPPMLYED